MSKIRKEVGYLCKSNSSPTLSDSPGCLKGCPDIGPKFGNEENPADTVTISAYVDAAHTVHIDGASQSVYTFSCAASALRGLHVCTASSSVTCVTNLNYKKKNVYTFSVGEDATSFAVHSGVEISCVSPDAMGIEYIALLSKQV
jgi:hypothetical protein